MIPCAHGKRNVKHHRTSPKPEIHIRVSQQRKTNLRWPGNSIEHQNVHRWRSNSSSSSSSITYVCTQARPSGGEAAAPAMRVFTYVCIQARPISTNRGSMEEECEYGLTSGTCLTVRRLEVVACLVGFRVFFSFSLLRTHKAYCKYEATLPHIPLY